ncbi:MAG: cadherin-like beta sandwich domain-containing protein, partial [Bacilli bacterium]|nr:cadherin-like beta sandwich domain-containing protein [Bacilli bacterium]
ALSLSTTIDNYYEINVTAEDGHTQETYTIKVIRPKSSDATLKAVNVTGGSLSPAVSAGQTSYTITLPTGSTSFSIEGIANATTTQVFGNGSYTLADSPVTLTTKAEDGTEETYTFTITQALSNDATLASLSVTDHNLDKTFGPTVLGYDIGNVTYGTTQLVVNAVPTNINSTLQYFLDGVEQSSNIINIPNTLGQKQITVTVTAPDGETQESYTIDYTLVQSSNAFLKMITPSVGTLNPAFEKTTKDYEVAVNGETESIDFTIEAEDSNSTVTVDGDNFKGTKTITMSGLTVGENTLTILVTAQDGTTETYTVKVKKELGISKVITSDIYGHTIKDVYIMTVVEHTTGSQLKDDQLDNPSEYLEIWTADESTQVADTDELATGMIVKLMIDGVEHDRKHIVIKGDVSGEGEIDLYDATIILNHVLLPQLSGAYLQAGYVSADDEIDLYDATMILNYVLSQSWSE